jgi:multiple sugar transport system permease protein/raffinose/stachyose/melibiose transport system permease protein
VKIHGESDFTNIPGLGVEYMKGIAKNGLVTRSQNNFVAAALTPLMVVLIVFSVIPIVASIIISFYNYSGMGNGQFIGISNYLELFKNSLFYKALKNTVVFTLVAVAANLVISMITAVTINSITVKKLKDSFRGLFFMPAVVPAVAITYVWIQMFEPNSGIINQFLGILGVKMPIYWLNDSRFVLISVMIVLLWSDLGYNVVIIMAGLDGIPRMYYEAAHIDGANELKVFFKITLPLMARTMLFVCIMTCISYFQVFAPVKIMTGGGPDNASQVMAFSIYQNAFVYMRMGYASAMAVIMLLLILIISVLQLKAAKIDWEY